MSAATYLSGRLSGGGNRHWPSSATRAPNRYPSEASTTVERGALKEGIGASNTDRISTAAAPTAIFAMPPILFLSLPPTSLLTLLFTLPQWQSLHHYPQAP